MSLLIIFLVIINVFLPTCNGVCVSYQGNACVGFVSQEGVAVDVSQQETIEVVLESLGWKNFTTIGNVLAPDCSHQTQAFLCNYLYPPCGDSGGNYHLFPFFFYIFHSQILFFLKKTKII